MINILEDPMHHFMLVLHQMIVTNLENQYKIECILLDNMYMHNILEQLMGHFKQEYGLQKTL